MSTNTAGTVRIGALTVNQSDRSIAIDLSKLTSPTNVYDADVGWLEYGLGRVLVCFGTLDRDNKETLRSRLELKYPPEDFVRIFWGNSREFHGKIQQFVSDWETLDDRDTLHPEGLKAKKEHSQSVNFEYMAHSGSEAAIDFYHVPTTGVARFATNKGLAGLEVLPIVRVQLTVLELVHLLDSAAEIVDKIKNRIPKLRDLAISAPQATAVATEKVEP